MLRLLLKMAKLIVFICFLFVNYNSAFKLTVIHNNDIHSHFAETTVSSGVCTENSNLTCVGGTARLISKVGLSIKSYLFLLLKKSFTGRTDQSGKGKKQCINNPFECRR